MACFYPLSGWYSHQRNDNGKRIIVFKIGEALVDRPINVKCGRCLGCRLERARDWAVRCVHESQMHGSSSYVTLTYRPEDLPSDGSLHKAHFQKFMKRLRKSRGHKIRYYMCGEYGDEYQRPHYHALLFNCEFPDKRPFKRNKNGDMLYTSEYLDDKWGLGFCQIGSVSMESAGYVARYIMKKQLGDAADIYDELQILPEYTDMSRKPGVAQAWIESFWSDIYPADQVVLSGGRKVPPPRYYDLWLKEHQPEVYEVVRRKRLQTTDNQIYNNTSSRHRVRDEVTEARLKRLPRTYEDGSDVA